ncbi:MAG: hypothetical protein JRN20_18655 [Nitrososphaerota archaeon]|nr:hypothetical protein [Nitrososphaerota archaeon]
MPLPFDAFPVPLEIFLPLVMLVAPVIVGALRLKIWYHSLAIVAKVGAVFFGSYPCLILFNEIINSFNNVAGSEYTRLMLAFGVLSVLISWLLVSFGEWTGRKDGIRMSSAVRNISQEIKSDFLPLLDQFNYNTGKQVSELRTAVEGFTNNITDSFNSKVKEIEDKISELSNRIDGIFAKYSERSENYGIMVNGYNSFQKSFKGLLDDYHKDLESIKNMSSDLATRIEIYGKMKQFLDERERDLERREKEFSDRGRNSLLQSSLPNQSAQPNQKTTTLTADDGRASREIGDKTEEEFASTFREAGIPAERKPREIPTSLYFPAIVTR